MNLYLIYRKRDNGTWDISDYVNADRPEAERKMKEIEYRDNAQWNSNRIIAKFGNDVYVPVFKYQVRKIVQ